MIPKNSRWSRGIPPIFDIFLKNVMLSAPRGTCESVLGIAVEFQELQVERYNNPKSRKWSGTPRNLRVAQRVRVVTRKFRYAPLAALFYCFSLAALCITQIYCKRSQIALLRRGYRPLSLWAIVSTHFFRPERAEHISPGQRPG